MKNVLYTKDLRFRASFEVRREGNFLNFFSQRPAAGPSLWRRWLLYLMVGGNNLRIKAEYYDFYRKTSFHSFIFPTCSSDIALRGMQQQQGCKAECQKPPGALQKLVYEHFFRA
jgi:hypothetical protein